MQLLFEIVQIASSDHHISQQIKSQNALKLIIYFQARCHGGLGRKKNAISQSSNGKYFQASEYKRRNFFKLNNNDHQPICPTYSKDGSWPKHFSLLNSMYAYIMKLIINHVPIGEYKLRFFPKKSFICICREYTIKMRRHILFDCVWY